MRMHAGEVDIDVDLVRALVAGQFPELADQPIVEVRSTGTVNAIYRIGDQLYARLPRVAALGRGIWTGSGSWLPQLAPAAVPADSRAGRAGPARRGAYPFPWAIYRWLEGEPYADGLVDDETPGRPGPGAVRGRAARHRSASARRGGGRKPLRELDRDTRQVIDAARGVIDGDAAARGVAAMRSQAPAWDGTPVWIHADLLRPNVLVVGGRISAVIDFGGAGVGDPAVRRDRRLERVRPGRAGGLSRCARRRRRHLAPRPRLSHSTRRC